MTEFDKQIPMDYITAARTAEQYLLKNGWTVETKSPEEMGLITVSDTDLLALICGDGRFGNIPPEELMKMLRDYFQKDVRATATLFGGPYGVMVNSTGGDAYGMQKADSLIRKHNMVPVPHGDEHGSLKCGLLGLAMGNQLPPPSSPITLNADGLTRFINELGWFNVQLPGAHEETDTIFNFRPDGVLPINNPLDFRSDLGIVHARLGIPFERSVPFSATAVKQLKPDAQHAILVV
jgi:hypothetical protein